MVSERHLRWAVLASVAALLVTAPLARTHHVSGLEKVVDRWVYDLPTWSTGFWRVVMQCGSRAAIPAVLVVLLVLRRWREALVAGPVVFLAWMLGRALKGLIGRGRPTEAVLHRAMRDVVPDNGYPSTHTVVAVGLATALIATIPMSRRWRALVAGLAVGTGIARIHVTAHWPLDVVGGAAIGVGVVAGAVLLIDRWRPVS